MIFNISNVVLYFTFRTCELFITTEIKGDIKDELLQSMKTLRRTALEQNMGPELRFAVRSSGKFYKFSWRYVYCVGFKKAFKARE